MLGVHNDSYLASPMTNKNKNIHGVISFPDIMTALERISAGGLATSPSITASTILRHWLWGCDANEVCDRGKCDFHQMHLVAMVCTRVFTEAYQDINNLVDADPLIIDEEDISCFTDNCSIFLPHFYGCVESSNAPKPKNIIRIPKGVSLQQLRDLVHALQTQWPKIQHTISKQTSETEKTHLLQIADRLITQLFIWFGSYLFDDNIQEWQADDNEFLDHTPPTHGLHLTDMGIKFYINIFFVLFRLLFLQRHAIEVPEGRDISSGCYPFTIESFHLEAGVDEFHTLGMFFDIPAGCLLEYKHSYSGYYNNVSQCVYRHFPSYKRRIPVSLEDVLLPCASDLSVLPALKQIYPEIEFAFEDHHFQRQEGSVAIPVLMRQRQSLSHTPIRETMIVRNTNPSNKHKDSLQVSTNHKSENIQACITACSGGGPGETSNASDGMTGRKSMRTTDWFWFVIGGNIYLICTLDGMAYSGTCRDLLAFYLSINRSE
jgi:hypothetical protein